MEKALIDKLNLIRARHLLRGIRNDDNEQEWITVKGAHIPLDKNGELKGTVGKKIESETNKSSDSDKNKQPKQKRSIPSSIGNVTSGKKGNLKPKHDGAKTIDTKDAFEASKKNPNSLTEHMDDDGNLSEERQAVHDEIIKNFFSDKEQYGGTPSLVMSGGGPASGKTFVRQGAESEFGKDTTVTIDPDLFKEALPGYKEMAEKDESAASFYHEESSALAKRAYQYAVDNGINVVYDGTGDGSENSVMSKIKIAQDAGYNVTASYVTVDTETAISRNKARYEHLKEKYENGDSKTPPRIVPDSYVTECHSKVTDISVKVADKFDSFTLYDNNVKMGEKPIKIATCKKDGKITAIPGQEARLQKYLDKGSTGAKVKGGEVSI